jgi:DNA recombination protein RmuC
MNLLLILLGILIGLLLGFVLKEKLFPKSSTENDGHFQEIIKNAQEQLITMADQKLDAKKQVIDSDLAGKKDAIEKMVKNLEEDLKKNDTNLNEAEKARITSFTQLKTELENQRRISEQLTTTTENLKKVLSNNQLRGQFGEQVADDLLKMAGFVKGVDYQYNKAQDGSGNRPDFTVLLPDGVKINVDAKFPYANLQKYIETEDKEAQRNHLRSFETDIKEKVKQVTTRDYINPEDNTVDFVILFIPNEMIFSFIYEKMNDIWAEAMQKKVVFVGPFSFSATLRLIRQSYANFSIQNNVRGIVTLIKEFGKEFDKYTDEFVKIGERIASLSKQYEEVNGTRTRVLNRTVDKIKLEAPETLKALPEENN